jgi:hypothetical protein
MKKNGLLAALLFINICIFSLMPLTASASIYKWHTFYGSADGSTKAYGIVTDGSGNIYVSGYSNAAWTGPGGELPKKDFSGDWDIFVLKLDRSGNYLWHTFYGSASDSAEVKGIALDSSNNIHITGYSNAAWAGPSGEGPVYDHSGDDNIFVLKLNSNGGYVWHSFYGFSARASALALDGNSNIYVTGISEESWTGPSDADPVDPLNAYSGSTDIFVLKLDRNGTYLWHTFYGSSGADSGNGIALDSSGGIHVTGQSDLTWTGPAGELPSNLHSINHSATVNSDIFILKLNSSGAYQRHTFYGADDNDSAGNGITADSSGYIYVTGSSYAPWGSPIYDHSGAGANNIVVMKLNGSEALQWNAFFGAGSDDAGNAIALDSSGNINVAGQSNVADATWGPPVHAGSTYYDSFVLRLDNDGTYKWNTFYGAADDGTDGYDAANGIFIDNRGDTFVTGYSDKPWLGDDDTAPFHAHAGSDWPNMFIYKLGLDTCSDNPAKVSGVLYSSLQAGYAAASDGETIMLQALDLSGPQALNLSKAVTLKGGYECDFNTNPGWATISSSLTIKDGKVNIDKVTIR